MKILICNTPLRDEHAKTVYPPLGAMAVAQSLEAVGHETIFYDINYFRPSNLDTRNFLLEHKFNIIGISATTSSTYKDTKELITLIKATLPKAIVIVGGALAFSAEILLKLAHADFTVLGEGELIAVNLVNHLVGNELNKYDEDLQEVKGISYLDQKGEVVFTGYEKQIPANEIPFPDYTILQRYSVLDQYMPEPEFYEQFKWDPRTYEPHRKGKRLATVVASRGCISRCTFCHRWQQGIRMFSLDRIMDHIEHLIDKYNIGFISFGDEDFGATKKWVAEFSERISRYNILYRLSAVRVDNINADLLKLLRESGCIAVHYGWESGSTRMLGVMEKMVTAEQNDDAARWTAEAGLQTVPALVVGMPGENYHTINETTEFVKRVVARYKETPVISVNQLVALPGTPVYEFARKQGYLGGTLQDEEHYLIRINNKGGESALNLNLTDYPFFIGQGWIRSIYWACRHHHRKVYQLPMIKTHQLIVLLLSKLLRLKRPNVPPLQSHPIFYHWRHVLAPLYAALITFSEYRSYGREGIWLYFKRWLELFAWPLRKKYYAEGLPLRKYLQEDIKRTLSLGKTHVSILRLGR